MAQIDSSIYGQFAPKVKSIQEYNAEADQAQLNQLNVLSGHAKLAEYQRGLQQQNVLRTLQQSIAGKGRLEQAKAYGDAGFIDQSNALYDAENKANTAKASANKDNAEAYAKNAEAVHRDASLILANPSQQTAMAVLDEHEKRTGMDFSAARKAFIQAGDDPEAIKRVANGIALKAEQMLPKIEKTDFGGGVAIQSLDPLTGKIQTTQTLQKTQSPDNIANNETSRANNASSTAATLEAARIRAQAGADKAAAPKPLPAAALKLQKDSTDAIGSASAVISGVEGVLANIDSGKLNLSPTNNFFASAKNKLGMSDEGSRAYADAQSTVKKAVNDSLMLNKGVQTEGDAQRAADAILANLNDKAVVKQQLEKLRDTNRKAILLHKNNIDGLRANFGVEPMDYSTLDSLSGSPAPADNDPLGLRKK